MQNKNLNQIGKHLEYNYLYLYCFLMKTLFIISLFFLASCISKTEAPTTSEASSENFVDTYVDTLETSVSDARDVANTMNAQQEELKGSLEGVE